MDDTASLLFGVVDMVEELAQRLFSLKIECEELGSLPDNWNSSIKSFEHCRTSLKAIQETFVDEKESISEFETTTTRISLKEVEESLTAIAAVLNSLDEEDPPFDANETSYTAGTSSNDGDLSLESEKRFFDHHLTKVGKPSLKEDEVICKETQCGMECSGTSLPHHSTSSDKYLAHLGEPPLSNNVVLNVGFDITGACSIPAGRTNSASGGVLADAGRSASGPVGMGELGKTVSPQGLCCESEVQPKCFNGRVHVNLGQDAAEEEVIDDVSHIVII